MMKNNLLKRIALIIVFFFAFSLVSYAQAEYVPLINVSVNDINLNAGSDSLESYLGNIFRFGIIIIGILAVLSIALAGIQYMTSETPFKLGNAKDRMQNAVIGIILALSAYVILNTINPDLVRIKLDLSDITPDRIDTSQIEAQERALMNELIADQEVEAILASNPQDPSFQIQETEARDLFGINKISVNSFERTSLVGLRENTINGLITMKDESGVSGLVITGGTEGGHAGGTYSHANGYKIDIGKNSNASNWNAFDSYIKSRIGTSNVEAYKPYKMTLESGQEVVAYYENNNGTHWDLTFK